MTVDSAVDWRLTNVARIYDALLGGTDNLAPDRDAARQLTKLIPDAPRAARSNREFLVRAVGHLNDFIDFSQPVAVLLVAVLHFIHDSEHPWSAVKSITDYLAPGSYLVLSHVTGDNLAPEVVERANGIYDRALVRGAPRSHSEIMRFFDGLEVMPPGLVDVADWRPGHCARPDGRPVLFWAGVGRKAGLTGTPGDGCRTPLDTL